jgi:Fic family protein
MSLVKHFSRDRIDVGKMTSFVCESNEIEGIKDLPSQGELRAVLDFLTIPTERGVQVKDIERLAHVLVGRGTASPGILLRARRGMDVYIRGSSHIPPPGGRGIVTALERLLARVSSNPNYTPFQAHRAYEALHPFMDGNGRTGRVLWAWHMIAHGRDPFGRRFLHTYYYQSLEEGPRWTETATQ